MTKTTTMFNGTTANSISFTNESGQFHIYFPNYNLVEAENPETGEMEPLLAECRSYALPKNVLDPMQFVLGVQQVVITNETANVQNTIDRLFKRRKRLENQIADLEREGQDSSKLKKQFSDTDAKLQISVGARELYKNFTSVIRSSIQQVDPDRFMLAVGACISTRVDFKSADFHVIFRNALEGMRLLKSNQLPTKEHREKMDEALNRFLMTQSASEESPSYKSMKVRLSQARYIDIITACREDLEYGRDGILPKKLSKAGHQKLQNTVCKQALLSALQICFNMSADSSEEVEISPLASI